ncbi:MAG: class I SAM-dependent methyltransferase [Candidatus Aminicenantia bacterium]
MNKEKVSRFYDIVWTEYLPEYEASQSHLELFFKDDEIVNRTILDAGCGTGIFTIIFANKGAKKVIGVDISEGSLNTGRELKEKFKLSNVEFQKDDMLNLSFKENTFDIVWAWGTIHHTEDPYKAMEELIRVLKKDGIFFMALYKKTKLTFIHEIIRRVLIKTPRKSWTILSKIMAFFLSPIVFLFKKREKSRKGEKLEELILDWYFVPIRHYFYPERIKSFLEKRNFIIEKFLPASGRFNSTSNFIFKAKRYEKG